MRIRVRVCHDLVVDVESVANAVPTAVLEHIGVAGLRGGARVSFGVTMPMAVLSSAISLVSAAVSTECRKYLYGGGVFRSGCSSRAGCRLEPIMTWGPALIFIVVARTNP